MEKKRFTFEELSATVFILMLEGVCEGHFSIVDDDEGVYWNACHEFIFNRLADELLKFDVFDIEVEKALLQESVDGDQGE